MVERLEQVRKALADRYAVDRELGEGGMATVYLATDLKHQRPVAIKVLRPKLAPTIGVKRFLREIEVIAQLQHPHILMLIDSGDIDGLPYYVMPYVEGQSLSDHLAAQGPFPLDEALRITHEIADGLHHAHEKGIIHRDIKPANVLMSGGHAMIADFGIATALEYASLGRMTETGISLGSPVYMSPEQAAGERDLDRRSDIYSLACVTYEMLSGKPPVDETSMQTIVTGKLTGTFRSLDQACPGLPDRVVAAVTKALAINATDRYETARAYSEALGSAPSDGTVTGPGRRRMIVGLAAAAAVALVAVGFSQVRARNERALFVSQQLAEIGRLAGLGQGADAFYLAEELDAAMPGLDSLDVLRPQFTDFLPLRTNPPGARVYRQSYDDPMDEWELIGTTPIDSLRAPKWGADLAIRLKIEADGYRTVELLPNAIAPWAEYRGRFPMDTVILDPAEDGPTMVRIPGFELADPHPEHDGQLVFDDYFMAKYEVTNREYKTFVDAGGYRDREYWTDPFMDEGRELSWEDAMDRLTDETGRPGPANWRLGTYDAGHDDYPVTGVSYYEAAAYARFMNMELPTSWHWDRAAIRFQRENSWIVNPNSNLTGDGL